MIGLHHHHMSYSPAAQARQLRHRNEQEALEGRASYSLSSGAESQPRAEFVRVPAKTALPLVSSVPKSGAGSRRRCRDKRPLELPQPTATGGRRPRAQLEADEQVLLLVQDGLGVPVLGRRLAAKSRGPAPETQQVPDYSQPTSVQVDGPPTVAPPVVGRRSHRLLQPAGQLLRLRDQQEQQVARARGQRFSLLEAASLTPSERVHLFDLARADSRGSRRGPGSSKHLSRYQSMSALAAAGLVPGGGPVPVAADDYALPPMQLAGELHLGPLLQFARPGPAGALVGGGRRSSSCSRPRRLPVAGSSSCSSLCSSQATTTAAYCRGACCRPPVQALDRPAEANQMPCQQPCCQRLPAAPSGSLRGERPQTHCRLTAFASSSSSPSPGRLHSTCQANGGPQQLLRPVAFRSSSCHDRCGPREAPPPVPSKPAGHLQHLGPAHGNPAEQRARQRLAGSVDRTCCGPATCCSEEAASAVTQMYESLAAELKAKLGNPEAAPILLPPRDYDTLSRRQGKLTGIESRRSTNPQLVGPAPAVSRKGGSACIAEEEPSGQEEGVGSERRKVSKSSPGGVDSCAGSSSSRSSGRSEQPEVAPVGLQRSRSNSSSGLGSISLGANSPTDSQNLPSSSSPTCSKASSSEDMRADHLHRRHRLAGAGLARSRRHQAAASSPNDCNSSDSGQSGCCENQLARRDDKETIEKTTVRRRERGKGIEHHNPSKVSNGIIWNGRVEIPLKVNSQRDGSTYLAIKQIIY